MKQIVISLTLCLFSAFATTPVLAWGQECEAKEVTDEYCMDCTYFWWWNQDICDEVTYDAFCDCTTGTEECYDEEGECDYIPEGCQPGDPDCNGPFYPN